MENNTNNQDSIPSLARRHGLSIDTFEEIANTRSNLFEVEVNKVMQDVKLEYELCEHGVSSLLRKETSTLQESKDIEKQIDRNTHGIDRIESNLRSTQTGRFIHFVLQSRFFWAISFLTIVFMGVWTFVTWILVRRRVVDITDIIGGLMGYFNEYSHGVPFYDVFMMVGMGMIWTFFFWIIYIYRYNSNFIHNESRWWKLEEACWVLVLVLIEILLTISSAHSASLASLTNKQLSEASGWTIFFESFPLIAGWLLWHFLVYKSCIIGIRRKASLESGELYLVESKVSLNKLKLQKDELESRKKKLQRETIDLKNVKLKLYDSLSSFKATNHDIHNKANAQKNAVIAFSQEWLVASLDELKLKGQSAHTQEYEVAIKNVIKEILESLDKLAIDCSRFIEDYHIRANKLLKHLDFDYKDIPHTTIPLLPTLPLVLSLFLFGCSKSAIFNEQPKPEPQNVILGVDLSNRFLQDTGGLFLPADHDLAIIEKAYQYWEQDIINVYDQGFDVSHIEGAFLVIPISIPNEAKRNLSSLGFCLELSHMPLERRWEHLASYQDTIIRKSELLYNAGLELKPFGSDIWSFFRDLSLYLKPPQDSIPWGNKLILLTDGYPYFEPEIKNLRKSEGFQRDYLDEEDMNLLRNSSSWSEDFERNKMGFLPIMKTYSDLEVLVIGINEPSTFQGSAIEFSILERYWSDFFDSMGIKEYRFLKLESPAIETVLDNFLNH